MCDTEKNIKIAAIDILLKDGNFELSMHEIAERSSVSRTVIHYYFRSKENLLSVVNKKIIQEIVVPKYDGLFSKELLTSKIEKYIRSAEEVAQSYPYLDVYVISQCKSNLAFKDYLRDVQQSYNLLLAEIQDAIDKGTISYTAPDCFLIDLFSLTTHAYMYKKFFDSEPYQLSRCTKTNSISDRKQEILNILFKA